MKIIANRYPNFKTTLIRNSKGMGLSMVGYILRIRNKPKKSRRFRAKFRIMIFKAGRGTKILRLKLDLEGWSQILI